MNNNFAQDQQQLTLKHWCGQRTDRLDVWKNYLFKHLSVSWEMEYWFYWMAYFMEHSLKTTIGTLEKIDTKDVRYLDQARQMTVYVNDVLYKCRCVLTAQRSRCFCADMKFPCQSYRERFKCHCFQWDMTKVGCLWMCGNAKNALIEDVSEVMKNFLAQWLSKYYYVWKLNQQGRLHLPVPIHTHTMLLSDIHLWEVVCEDEERQILSHPLLPHPLDFLEKHNVDKTSTLYVDKARFEYQIPGSLVQYAVVLSHKPSIIPRLGPVHLSSQEEEVVCSTKHPASQVFYRETTTGHKKNEKHHHKKRRLSKILKETRKKKKTRLYRPENNLRQTFAIDQGDDYTGIYDDDTEMNFCDYDDFYYCYEEWF